MLQEVMNELMLSKETEHAAQVNLLKVIQSQLLRDQNSHQEFFPQNQFKSTFQKLAFVSKSFTM